MLTVTDAALKHLHTALDRGDTGLATPEPLIALLAERVLDLDDDGNLVLIPRIN